MDDSLELRKQNLKYLEDHEKGFTGPVQLSLIHISEPTRPY